MWWWCGCCKASVRTKIASSHTLSFLQTRKRERGKRKQQQQANLQNKIVNTSKSTHPIKFPSFLLFSFLFFFLIWLLRTKDPQSSTDCIYTIWNVRMSLCFYVQNSNGKDSLDLCACSHRRNVQGGGEGRPTASYHIYIKNKPFSHSKLHHWIWNPLNNHPRWEPQNIFKNHTYLRKNSLQTTAFYWQGWISLLEPSSA